jgi:hypothetical protein
MDGNPYLSAHENPAPALEPLSTTHSEVVDDTEAAIQEGFNAVFASALRPAMTRLGAYGMPHRADFVTMERFIKAAGLAMDRRTSGEAYMGELFRAWVARNPKRGLWFLRTYLRLLYPGVASVAQLWCTNAATYPASCTTVESAGAFLTSPVRVSLSAAAGTLTGGDIARIRGVATSVIPARMVLEIWTVIGEEARATLNLGAAGDGVQILTINGYAST